MFASFSKTTIVFLTLGWKNKSRIAMIFALLRISFEFPEAKGEGNEGGISIVIEMRMGEGKGKRREKERE